MRKMVGGFEYNFFFFFFLAFQVVFEMLQVR